MVSTIAEQLAPVGASVDVNDVSHRFDLDGKALVVLNRISLRIQPRALVSLLGRSGCGKSALLRLVARPETPTLATIQADGETITPIHRAW